MNTKFYYFHVKNDKWFYKTLLSINDKALSKGGIFTFVAINIKWLQCGDLGHVRV